MKNLKLLPLLVFALFFISTVSAVAVYGDWEDSSQSITIIEGDSISFNADFISVNPPMTLNIKLYDSNSNLVHVFENAKRVSDYNFSNTYGLSSGTYQNPGNYELILSGIDEKNSQSYSLFLTVRPLVIPDNTAPVITLLGANPITLTRGTAYTEYGATALDDVDGDITGNIIITNPVNIYVLGTYIVRYNVQDAAGNSATEVTRTVNVVSSTGTDTTAPIITLLGANPITITRGTTYTDAGATAFDDVDGDITNQIVVVNPVNSNVIGIYTITYNVQDTAGNAANEVTRTVNVVSGSGTDTTAPILTVVVPQPSTYNSNTFSFEATINEAGTIQYSLDGATNVSMTEFNTNYFESALLTLADGNHSVTFYAFDLAGNLASKNVNFSIDTSSTTFNLNVISPKEGKEYSDSDLTYEVTVDVIAEVEFSINGENNVSMNFQGITNGILRFTYDETLSDGDYTITFYAEDTAGNLVSKTIDFSVDTSSKKKKEDKKVIDDNFYEELYLEQFNKKPAIHLNPGDSEEDLNCWQRFLNWFRNTFCFEFFFFVVGLFILICLIILYKLIRKLRSL